jgi:DNA (cytosine-5)-methyltransferase 1
MRLVGDFKPAWFLIENVWGLQHVANGHVEDHIVELGSSMGYQVTTRILNAVDYGVPQKRRRIFFIGFLGRSRFIFPESTKSSGVTVREAIGDLPSLINGDTRSMLPYRRLGDELSDYQMKMRGANEEPFVRGNLVTRNNEIVLSRYRHIPPGCNWRSIPPELMANYKNPAQCHTGIYRRLEWDAPSVVISNFRKNMLIHPEEDRGLSVREAARLQAFPDSFILEGCLGSQQQQAADAVPPLLAQILAVEIRKFLN